VARGKWLSYLEHGHAGAVELNILGAEPIVVDFARHHHGERPDSISVEDWTVLQASDRSRREPEGARRKRNREGR
jgi:hypothetical protein